MIDFVRTALNPWNQEVLIGVSWDLMWLALAAGVAFAIGHTIWKAKLAPTDDREESGTPSPVRGDEKVQKYTTTARAFHWIMAAAMIVLLVTAFFPVVGIQFPWVTIHWIAGVVLTALIVFHIFHSTIWLDFWSMWVDRVDLQNAVRMTKRYLFGSESPLPKKEGKYALPNKLFHHGVALFGLAMIVTGILMMFRVETPLWTRDPYLFSDQAWGWIYVIHGISAVAFITMVMAHIYFGVRPEKLWMTRSMILGWITGEEYSEHHDPERWQPGKTEAPEPAGSPSPAGAEAAD